MIYNKFTWGWQLEKMKVMRKPKSDIVEMQKYITENNLWNRSILEV